jgi:hypothetical protein
MATFNGKNYSIEATETEFVLVHPVSENETFASFDELVESHPICEEARDFFFGAKAAAINADWYSNCQANADEATIKSWFVQVFNQDVEIDDELSIWLTLANDWATQEQIDTAVATIEAGV